MIAPSGIGDVALAFWNGSLGTRSALVSGTLVRFVPLALTGCGLAIAFRAGVFNIGAEGQLLIGAVAATVVGLHVGHWPPVLGVGVALAASVAAGGAWAGIAASLRSRFEVLEVISTIMLNFIAIDVVSYLVRGPLQEPTHVYPQTPSIAPAARLPALLPATRLHVGIVAAVLVCVLAWLVMTRTAAGFRLRIVGASPAAAAAAARIDVMRVSARALIVSGALAGLAGGIEVTGVTYALYDNLSPGYGFSAIAVAVLARLNPLGVIASALAFAVLETGALGMQRDAGVPAVIAGALEATAILALVAWAAASRAGRRRGSSVAP